MADEDKLLGIAKANRTTEYTYTAYRIDYDSAESVADLLEEGESYSGATKNPPEGYPGHEASGSYTDADGNEIFYKRKVLVEDATTRDEVEAELAEADIAHTVETISPTTDEKAHIEDYGAENSLEGADAMAWKRQLEDLANGNISQVDVERGRNPHTDEHPGRPKSNPGRGN